jgi:hypothetical protein
LSQINPVHTTPSYLSKIHFNIITHLYLGLPSGRVRPLYCDECLKAGIGSGQKRFHCND